MTILLICAAVIAFPFILAGTMIALVEVMSRAEERRW